MSILCRIGLHAWRWQGHRGYSYPECERCRVSIGRDRWWQWRIRRAPNGENWHERV